MALHKCEQRVLKTKGIDCKILCCKKISTLAEKDDIQKYYDDLKSHFNQVKH